MTVTRSVALFVLAALIEIGGAWLVWQGIREHKGWTWIGAGVIGGSQRPAGYGRRFSGRPDAGVSGQQGASRDA